jgi:hypothetical protein
VLEAGEFMLQTGNLTEKIVCKENKNWETPNK